MSYDYLPDVRSLEVSVAICSDHWDGHSKRINPIMQMDKSKVKEILNADTLMLSQANFMHGGNDFHWQDEPHTSSNEVRVSFTTKARNCIIPIMNVIKLQLLYTTDTRPWVYGEVLCKWNGYNIVMGEYGMQDGAKAINERVLNMSNLEHIIADIKQDNYEWMARRILRDWNYLTIRRTYPLTLAGVQEELTHVCENSEMYDILVGIRTIMEDFQKCRT